MRLDKFLKLSRLIKRRTVANEFCDAGGVTLQGRPAKASSEIHVGDRLVMTFPNRVLEVEILKVPERAPSVQEADSLYQVIRDTARRESPPS
jgi:ribosomal 50S subunit-recycling heat shock protein